MRLAEDRFLQDLIEAEFKDEFENDGEVGSEDEAGQKMLQDRKIQARRRALAKSRAASEHQLAEQLLEGQKKPGQSSDDGVG